MKAGEPESDLQKVIPEMRIQQLEPEMQNEELRRTKLELEDARRLYEELFDFAPVGYGTLDARGAALRVNLAGAALLGVPRTELRGRPLAPLLSPSSRPLFAAFLSRILAGEAGRACEVEIPQSAHAVDRLR